MASQASLRRLKFCNFKLESLLEITNAINDNLPIEKLLLTYKSILIAELNIGKLAVFANNNGWESMLSSGVKMSSLKKVSVERDLLNIHEITTVTSTGLKHLMAFAFIIPVFHKETPLAYVLIGDVEEEKEGVSPTIKHLHFIKTLTNVIFVAIENKRLHNESLRQERFKKEMELASHMQSMLIPNTLEFENIPEIDAQSFYLPHFAVGGDYYDFGLLHDKSVFFCIADVSGKGISAALLMSNFQAGLRTMLNTNTELPDLVRNLNKMIIKNAGGERFITFFIAKYRPDFKIIEYINAGHNPPLLHAGNEITELKDGCPGVGMLDDILTIKKGIVNPVNTGTRIILYTDGIDELEDTEGKPIGRTELNNSLLKTKTLTESFDYLHKKLELKKSNQMIFDDITLLGLFFK
jgi:sigma-B regulation protein RsbU (phosphoserine phosphatase)